MMDLGHTPMQSLPWLGRRVAPIEACYIHRPYLIYGYMRPLCTYDIKTPQTKLNTPLMFMPWDVIYYHGGDGGL